MNAISYDQRVFVAVENSPNGQVSSEVVFRYFQKDNIVWATYQGGAIKQGTLVGFYNEDMSLNFVYQHIDCNNHFKTGKCSSIPEMLSDGRIRLHETWQWTCDDLSEGTSVIEEVVL